MSTQIKQHTKDKGNITIDKPNIKIKPGINKTLNVADINEWPILNALKYFLRNYTNIETRLPLGNHRRNIRYTHFYKLNTKNDICSSMGNEREKT